jgi:hypothetical protein
MYTIHVAVDLNGDCVHSIPEVLPPHKAAVADALNRGILPN